MLQAHPAFEPPRTDTQKSDTVTVRRVHIRLNLENETGKSRFRRLHIPHRGMTSQRRLRPVQKCIQNFPDTEIVDRRTEKDRRKRTRQKFFQHERIGSPLDQFDFHLQLLHFHRGVFRLRRKIVFDSLAIGMSPFLMNTAACLIVILINQGLNRYGGDLAVGAYGIVNRLAFVVVMIVMGLNQGMQPIAGYNYGARLYPRVTRVLLLTIAAATCVTT